MKKTLSLVLATVLAFGGSVSAFAFTKTSIVATNSLVGQPFYWSADAGKFQNTTKASITYGSTFGFLITDGTVVAKDSDDVKSIKAYPDYQIPNSTSLVEKVAVEYKKYNNGSGDAYAYFATVKTKASTTASNSDLYGTMYVGTSKTSAQGRTGATFTITLANNPDGTVGGTSYSAPTSGYSNWTIDFDGSNDVDIDFNGLAQYTVDATGQGKLNCGYTTKFNSEFAAKYPDANLEFISWGAKPSFNRIGELTIYADPDTFLYQITEDGFKEVTAKYDADYEAFILKTRTLGAFVISDIELEAEVIDETPTVPEVPGTNPGTGGGVIEVPNNGGKPNPNTGR